MFDKFQDYMYYLLFSPLKKIGKSKNQFHILFKVFGKLLDQIKKDIFKVREQSMVISASGKVLDEHGADRNVKRLIAEDDEQYRIRLSMQNLIAEKAGSTEGIIYALKSLGLKNFNIEPVWEEYPERWAEFYVTIDEKDMDLFRNFNVVRSTVRDVKMASSLPNYKFKIHLKNTEKNEVRVRNIFAINFYGNIPLYLDGTWLLDGINDLNGHESYFESMKLNITNRFFIPNNEMITSSVRIEKNLWLLDGINSLDGTKLLNAEIIEEVL